MRVAGITIPDKKHLSVSLTEVYGIGYVRAKKILDDAKVSGDKKATDLTPDEEKTIRDLIEAFTIEGDLRRDISGNVKRLKDIKAYRGSRHAKSLPARGQRTKN